ELMDGSLGESHSGELRRETAEQRANRIIAEELSRLGWKEVDLKERLRNDPGKLEIATRIRKETTLPIHWIARRLQLGTPKSARSMIHEKLQSNEVERKKPLSCKQLELQPIV